MSATTSRRKAGSSTSSASNRTSAASSGVIPTVAARAARKKEARTERRLEDLLDDTLVADDNRRMDTSMSAFMPAQSTSTSSRPGKSKLVDSNEATGLLSSPSATTSKRSHVGSSAAASLSHPPKQKRRLRETLGDDTMDGFIFSRETSRQPTRSASNGLASRHQASSGSQASSSIGPSAGRTTFEPLSDAVGGETPIIRRNQAFRAGLEKHPRIPTGKEANKHRRSSLGLKGQKRMSSLRDGTAAYPHDDVPDHELYRHCSADLPPVIRMRHLIGWILKRSLEIAFGKADLPVRTKDAQRKSKGKSKETNNELPSFTDSEMQLLSDKKTEIGAVLDQLLTDLNNGAFGITWMGQSEEAEKKGLQPHPRNVSNREASSRLSSVVDAMTKESQTWNKELTRIEDYEAETSRLEQLLDASSTELEEVIAWDQHDLDDSSLAQLKDAEGALDWLHRLTTDEVEQDKSRPRSKGRTSKAASAQADAEEFLGTERDARWTEVEFNVDLLRSRSHQFAQLESLASKYIRTVSAHAAQALRDRTSSSSALAGNSSSTAKRNRRKAGTGTASDSARGGSDRLEMLLSGIRESKSISAASNVPISQASLQEKTLTGGDRSMVGDVSASVIAFEPDESDPTDLLRALARM